MWPLQSEPFRRKVVPPDSLDYDGNWFGECGAGSAGKSIVPAQSVYRRKPHKAGGTGAQSGKIILEFSFQFRG